MVLHHNRATPLFPREYVLEFRRFIKKNDSSVPQYKSHASSRENSSGISTRLKYSPLINTGGHLTTRYEPAVRALRCVRTYAIGQ
ncbi:hypothetical protein ACS0PU_007017 [Formica fusca]